MAMAVAGSETSAHTRSGSTSDLAAPPTSSYEDSHPAMPEQLQASHVQRELLGRHGRQCEAVEIVQGGTVSPAHALVVADQLLATRATMILVITAEPDLNTTFENGPSTSVPDHVLGHTTLTGGHFVG